MVGFVVGVMVSVLILMCLVLCQIQKPRESTEKIYFAAVIELDGTRLYLSHDGSWGRVPEDTVLARTVKELEIKCKRLNAEVTMIEKIGVRTRFIQEYK